MSTQTAGWSTETAALIIVTVSMLISYHRGGLRADGERQAAEARDPVSPHISGFCGASLMTLDGTACDACQSNAVRTISSKEECRGFHPRSSLALAPRAT